MGGGQARRTVNWRGWIEPCVPTRRVRVTQPAILERATVRLAVEEVGSLESPVYLTFLVESKHSVVHLEKKWRCAPGESSYRMRWLTANGATTWQRGGKGQGCMQQRRDAVAAGDKGGKLVQRRRGAAVQMQRYRCALQCCGAATLPCYSRASMHSAHLSGHTKPQSATAHRLEPLARKQVDK